jgi:ATP-dependent protease ClpP protease subunit
MQIQEIQVPLGNNNIIRSDYHTLIIEYKDEERIPLPDEDGNIMEGIFEIIPSYTKYRLFIGDFMDDSLHGWNEIKDKLMNAEEIDFLEVHISSPGGYTTEGIELFNIINTKFKNAQVYLNYGFSMGALTFLYFDDRTIYEHSEIMFHNWSGGFGGKAQDIEDHFNHTKRHLKGFFQSVMKPYFSKKEIKNILNGKEKWLSSYEMLKRGIATGIIKDGEFYESEDYLKKFKKNGKIRKSYAKKLEKEEEEAKKQQEVLQTAIQEALENEK